MIVLDQWFSNFSLQTPLYPLKVFVNVVYLSTFTILEIEIDRILKYLFTN